MPMNLCKLCKKRKATQTNSHIFPRFMGVSLLSTQDGKRKGFEIADKEENLKSFQDSPKEDYLLCPKCESDIGKLESYFAKHFFNEFKAQESYQKIYSSKGYNYLTVNNLDYRKFKLTLYTILWRAAASSLPYFQDVKLTKIIEENLRSIINKEIDFIDYRLLVVTTDEDIDNTKNFIYGISNSPDECTLWINEYIVFFDFGSSNNLLQFFNEIIIHDEELIKIGILTKDTWESLQQKLIQIKVSKLKN